MIIGDDDALMVKSSYYDFPNILYIPILQNLQETLYNYFSRVHSFAEIPVIIPYIFLVLLVIQQVFSIVLYGFNTHDSGATNTIFKVISPLWCGGGLFNESVTRIVSLIFIIIDVIILAVITWRSYVFKFMKYVSLTEQNIILALAKYYLPISLPYAVSGIAEAGIQFAAHNTTALDVIVFVFGIFVAITTIFCMILFFCPRIMLLKDPLAEWDARTLPITVFLNVIMTIFSLVSQVGNKTVKIVLAVILALGLIAAALETFFMRPYFNNSIIVYYCSEYSALAVTSIVNIIAVFVPNINHFITLIVFIVFSIIFFFVFSAWNTSFVSKLLMKIEMSEQDQDVFTANSLAQAIRGTIDFCPPFIFTWIPIERFVNRASKDNNNLLLVYARLVSAFPHYSFQLKLVTKLIKGSTILYRRNLYLQLECILQRRNTTTTPDITTISHQIDNYKRSLELNTIKFWENVSQNNMEAFWGNIETRQKQMFDLTRELDQSVFTFENCPAILSLAVQLHRTVTYNFDAIPPLKRSLELIAEGRPAHPDRALAHLVEVIPGVGNLSTDLTQDIQVLTKNDEIETEDDSQQEVDFALKEQIYQLIKSSSISKSRSIIVYLFFAAFLTAALSVVYAIIYSTNIVAEMTTTVGFLLEVNTLNFNLARYALLFYFKQAINANGSPLTNDDTVMKEISPNWFGNDAICPRLEVTSEDVNAVATELKQNLEMVTVYLSSLDESKTEVSNFLTSYNNDVISQTGSNIPTSVVEVLLLTDVNNNFIKTTLATYDKIKSDIEKFSNSLTFDNEVTMGSTFMFLTVLVDVLLFSLPLMLRIFFISTQMEEITLVFGTITSKDIKDSLQVSKRTKKEDTKDEKKEGDTNDNVILSAGSSTNLNGQLAVLMVLSFIPVLVCCLAFYFQTETYVDTRTPYCKSAAYMKSSQSVQRLAFLELMQAFQSYYNGNQADPNRDQTLIDASMAEFVKRLDEAKYDNSNMLTYSASQLPAWLNIEDEYRNTMYPLHEDSDTIPAVGAGWERLSFQKYTHANDNFIFFMSITAPGETESLTYYRLESYYFWWVYSAREVPYFDAISVKLVSDIDDDSLTVILAPIMVIFVVIAYLSVVVFLGNITTKVNTALMMLIDMKFEVVVNNASVMAMLTTGRYMPKKASVLQDCDDFTRYVREGIAVLDRDLNVVDHNNAFAELFPNITNFNEFEPTEDAEQSPASLNLAIGDCWAKGPPRFTKKFSVRFGEQDRFFEAECIAVCENRIAFENEGPRVTNVIVILMDNTMKMRHREEIEEKHRKISEMLEKVLPPVIVSELQKGLTTISYNVHSVTVGEIKVGASRQFSYTTKEPHEFYNKVYNILDTMMQKYPTLIKVRTFAHGYTFAGGVFMSVNKPEKHAEESIKYALEVLHALPNINKELGTEVDLVIGVHTGGPVVCGVLSIEMPQFQILGNVRQYSLEMKASGEKNQIHITRAVYELVFNLGFNIVESDVAKVGNESFQTYNIIP